MAIRPDALETSAPPPLTAHQLLIDSLLNTSVQAKVTRREEVTPGIFRFQNVVRPTTHIDFPTHPGEFALKLHETNPSAPLSPYYFNLRELSEELLGDMAVLMASIRLVIKPDFVTGIPAAGDALAKAFSKVTGIPRINILGKELKGNTRQIVPLTGAPRHPGARVLYVDDLVTGADTKIEAFEAGKAIGYRNVGVAVFLDRAQGGTRQLEDLLDIPVYAPLNGPDVLEDVHNRHPDRFTDKLYQQYLRYQ